MGYPCPSQPQPGLLEDKAQSRVLAGNKILSDLKPDSEATHRRVRLPSLAVTGEWRIQVTWYLRQVQYSVQGQADRHWQASL